MIAFADQPAVEDAGRRPGAVVPAHPFGSAGHPDDGQAFVGHTAQRLSRDDGGVADHRCRRGAQGAADTTDRQDRAHADHRVGRRDQHDVGALDRLSDTGSGGCVLGAHERETVRGHFGPIPHPPLLEMDRTLLPGLLTGAGIGYHNMGLATVVAGGKQLRTGRPAAAQRLGHRRQGVARSQHLAAHQMGGQVAVAQAEPIWLNAIGGEFFLRVPGLIAMPPSAFVVDASAQGVHAGIEIRADAHAEHPRVVADIDDCAQLMPVWIRPALILDAELAQSQ